MVNQKQLSPETLARMQPATVEKYEELIEEDQAEKRGEAVPVRSGPVCESAEEALAVFTQGFRYKTVPIVGTGRSFRLRSLTTSEYLAAETTNDLIALSVVDSQDRSIFTLEHLARLEKTSDGRSFIHLKAEVDLHTMCGGTLEGFREAAAKNSGGISTSATG